MEKRGKDNKLIFKLNLETDTSEINSIQIVEETRNPQTHCVVCESVLKITIQVYDTEQPTCLNSYSKHKTVNADMEHLEKNTDDLVSERWCPNCGLLYKPE